MPRKSSVHKIEITSEGKVDLLTLIADLPSEFQVKVDDECITLNKKWHLKRTEKSCEVTVKRCVNAEKLALALGLYRAEGQKRPRRVRFVNKDPMLHRWFVEALREMGVSEFKAYAQYCFCEECGLRKLKEAVKKFEEMTRVKVINVYRNEAAHNPTFYLDVNNKALAVLLITAEKTLRKEIAYGNVPRNIANRYLRGVMEGDGSLNLKIDNGKVKGMYLETFESDADAVRDLLTIIKKLIGINLVAYKTDDQRSSINLYDLLEMLVEDLIPTRYIDKVKERIMIAFQRKGTPWILMKLAEAFDDKWFSSKEAGQVIHKARHHALEKLRALEKRGYLISKKVKDFSKVKPKGTPVRRLFKLTRKAKKLTKILKSLLPSSLPSTSFLSSFSLL